MALRHHSVSPAALRSWHIGLTRSALVQDTIMPKIDLRRLILLLALATGVVTFINGLFASYLT